MNYEDARLKAAPAIKEIVKLHKWDGIYVDIDDKEPIVIVEIVRPVLHLLLAKFKVIKLPEVPERIEGIRCKVIARPPVIRTQQAHRTTAGK